ncbi:helix-turn-helix transcriptional regulator [Streptomyces sp. NPDC004787]|uniref:helix-turn-helix domain-containing protein n=1 Tax=Streptomyces sp. NPDC004787 TaxID=3154291 RepID=UPI0033AC6C39
MAEARKKKDPPLSPRAIIGAELRHAREKKGVSQEALGELVFVSGSYIGQMEAGTRRIRPEMAVQLDEALGTNGFFERNCKAANKSKYPDHFAEAAEAEAEATGIKQFEPSLIPGLLQTPAYAAELFRAYQPTASDEEINELVDGRMARGRLLDDPTKPLLWVVMGEAALRLRVGGPAVMAEALQHLVALVRRHRVIVQVIPLAAGAHASLGGPLKLMTFEDAPPLAYMQGHGSGRLEDDPATVARHTLTYDLVSAAALAPRESLALIESAMEEYARETQPS